MKFWAFVFLICFCHIKHVLGADLINQKINRGKKITPSDYAHHFLNHEWNQDEERLINKEEMAAVRSLQSKEPGSWLIRHSSLNFRTDSREKRFLMEIDPSIDHFYAFSFSKQIEQKLFITHLRFFHTVDDLWGVVMQSTLNKNKFKLIKSEKLNDIVDEILTANNLYFEALDWRYAMD